MSSDTPERQHPPHQEGKQHTSRAADQHSATHKQAEDVLQESEEYFRAVWEAASDAMALSTPDGIVFAANPAYYRLYGYSPEAVLGKHFSLIFPEEQRAWAQELYKYMFHSPTISPSVESTVQRADGTERIVESSYTFITHDGARTAMISIIRDITAQKQVEQALRESQLKLHLALEIGHLGSWEWDIISNTLHWSANLEAAFGFAPGTFHGTYEAFLERVHPEDRTMVNQEVRRVLEEGTDYQIEFRAVLPDETVRWTRAHGYILADDAGQAMRLIGLCMDITEHKQSGWSTSS